MGGGESSSSSMASGGDISTGTVVELVRIGGAQLFLIDGEESVRMGQGYFTLIMMVQAHSPLAAVVAQVGDVQWPVGKDGPVLKLASYRYTFAIPGLLYGVTFPRDATKELIQAFESLTRQFCTYEVRPDLAEVAELSNLRLRHPPTPDDRATDGAQYWTSVADAVEQYSNSLAQRIKEGTITARGISKGSDWASVGISQTAPRRKTKFNSKAVTSAGEVGGGGGEMSTRMRCRVDQARRMSAVAKLVSRTVLKGAISATGHVASLWGSAVSQPMRGCLSSETRREVAVASVDAFAKVAEVVETAGKSLTTAITSVGTDLVQQRYGDQAGQVAQKGLVAVGDTISSMWTLNKIGLRMLWGATASSIFLNSPAAHVSHHVRSIASCASSSTSPETSAQSLLSSSTFSGVSTSSLSRGSSMKRTMSQPSQSQLHQLRDDMWGPPQRPMPSAAASGRPQNERDSARAPALETVQLFPSTPDRDSSHPHSNYSSFQTTTTGLPGQHSFMPQQLQHPAPLSVPMGPYGPVYYHPVNVDPNSSFHQFSMPSGPPQTRPFFPYSTGVDPSVTR